MRDVAGRLVSVNGRTVYVEQSGRGNDWVVFEAGGGCGRTCWDPVLPLLADDVRLVAYDRAGRARSGPIRQQLSIDEMADDLVAMTQTVVPGAFVLVAHSMGGLIARRAAERLGARLRGVLLVDPTPETSPVYDNWEKTVTTTDRMLALTQALSRFRPLAGLFVGNLRRLYPAETYRTMVAEDCTPAGIAQTRIPAGPETGPAGPAPRRVDAHRRPRRKINRPGNLNSGGRILHSTTPFGSGTGP